MNVFLSAFYAVLEVCLDTLSFFSCFLLQARNMVGVGTEAVNSERHDSERHNDLVVTDGADLSSLQGASR